VNNSWFSQLVHIDDENRSEVKVDKLIDGWKWFKDSKRLDDVMDFFARYVKKLHPDRYYKKTLQVDWGTLFLDMIGPSDIAYVICLIKNSMHIWTRVDMDGDQEGGTNKARPLFTSCEGKNRKFGETIWNKDGMAYFKRGVNAWKPLFKDEALKLELSNAWEEWSSTKGQK